MQKPNYFSIHRPEMLQYIPATIKNALEVGCGEGTFGSLLKDHFDLKITGLEIHEKSAEKAREHYDEIYCGDAIELVEKLNDKSFDVVICNDILEHLEDPGMFIQKVKPKVTDNAVIVSSIPNFRFVGNLKKIILKKDFKYEDSGILDRTHLRFFTQKSLVRFFNDCDLEIIKMEGINQGTGKLGLLSKPLLNLFGHGDILFLQFASVCRYKN